MHRFEVLSRGVVIGTSDLEHGDPPMGGAAGRFYPNSQYWSIQMDVMHTFDRQQEHLDFAIRISGNAALIEATGMTILDASDELGEDSIEVHVVGIADRHYEQLFPERYAAYEAEMRSRLR